MRQTEYQYLWVLGAVCPETGRGEGLLSPRLNTQVVQVFLREFSATLPADEHAVMLWDGAGFHTSGKLQVPDNITLLKLRQYSPELNPMETYGTTSKATIGRIEPTRTTKNWKKPPSTPGEVPCWTTN